MTGVGNGNNLLAHRDGSRQRNSQPENGERGLASESSTTSHLDASSLPSISTTDVLTGARIGILLSDDVALDARYVTELKRELSVSVGVPGVSALLSARANHRQALEVREASDSGARVQAVGFLYGSYLMSKADPNLVEAICCGKSRDLGRKALTDAVTNYAVNHLFDAERVPPLVAVLLRKERQGQTTYTEKKLLSGMLEPLAMGLARCTAGFPGSRLYMPRYWDNTLDPYLPRTPSALRARIDDAASTLLDSNQLENRTRRFLGTPCDHPELEAVLDTTVQAAILTNLEKFLLSEPILSDRDAKIIMERLSPPVNWGKLTKKWDAESLDATLPGKANQLIKEHTGARYLYRDLEPLDRAVILMAFAQVDIVFDPSAFAGTREQAQWLLERTHEWNLLNKAYQNHVQATLDGCYARALGR